MAPMIFELQSWQSVLLCLLFSVIYVGSLYVGIDDKKKNRDHPDTIKHRFINVSIITVIIPIILFFFGTTSDAESAHTFLEWLGIRLHGFIPSLILPLILTMVLFLGPLTLHYVDGVFRIYLEPRYWVNSLQNLIWIRNHIVAPITEEMIYRACMLPLLVPSFGTGWSVFLCPLFFGVAHFHHMIEKVIIAKEPVSEAFKKSLFQLGFTTVFGAYSAFLFLRTGHFVAPVVVHAFCNHMGFPAFQEVMSHPNTETRHKLMASFVIGLVMWMALLYPITSPFLYSNDIYDL
ncbi:CAAX prenyl protease 2 [Magallana gigas]|uniref:CAAX prenyl protease 2 n=1 Tax=Magallana gigas TaxID=29159 RepID=UPI0005C3C530|eukprot:XP_011431003.1 PREDICTED: CAAX prenyl protease 2-like [Crassostrea gigas]